MQAACQFFSNTSVNGSYLLSDSSGKITASCNIESSYIPASILKIPTALVGLTLLGKDFKFQTRFHIDQLNNLYIQGFGDPTLTSEEVMVILEKLKEENIGKIQNIVIDSSAFDLESLAPINGTSDNPYDAPVAPLSVNYNTVNFKVDDLGRVESNEIQTPTLPLMKQLAFNFKKGQYRVNILKGERSGGNVAAIHAGQLFRALQYRLGIPGKGEILLAAIPQDVRLIYTHFSRKSLDEILRSCLKYSNNFIANQVFLSCGIAEYGYPATWDKGRLAFKKQLRLLLGEKSSAKIEMVEGSGISRKNRVTASVMLEILDLFRPFKTLLPENQKNLIKSGTLSDVFSYAGYLDKKNAFVIILNQQVNQRDAILQALEGSCVIRNH